MVAVGLGKNLLFKSVLGHCAPELVEFWKLSIEHCAEWITFSSSYQHVKVLEFAYLKFMFSPK